MKRRLHLLCILLITTSTLLEANDAHKPRKERKSWKEKTKFKETNEKDQQLSLHSSSRNLNELDKEFSVISWNVFKGVGEKLFEKYNEVIKGYDFVLLQETYTSPQMLKIFKESSLGYSFGNAFVYRPNGYVSGVGIGTKLKPLNTEIIKGKYREPLIFVPKATIIETFKIKNKKESLMIVNVHAITFVTSGMLFHELDIVYNAIKSHKGPMLLAGDFNTWDKKKTKYLLRVAKKLGLKSIKYEKDERRLVRRSALDHLFYRGLKEVWGKSISRGSLSDHAAIEAKFKI